MGNNHEHSLNTDNINSAHDDHLHPEATSFISKYLISYDHKVIAKQFLWTGFFWGIIGFLMSTMIRWTQAYPGKPYPILGELLWPHSGGIIPPDSYASLFTMHGTIMIFFAITPILIGAFGNLLLPLMIGARDMIFPWLNMASFWVFALSSAILLASFFVPMGPSSVGWTSYPTLAHAQWNPGLGHSLWLIAIFFAGTSSIMGAINYITTVLRLRAPGMRMMDMPMTVWGIWLTAVLNAVFLPVLAAGLVLLYLDRTFGTQFFLAGAIADARTQGDPILYQHLFWIFGHPEVYIVILPGWGLVSDLLSFFARKPATGYKWTVWSMISISFLSTVVYGHHMFTTGLTPLLNTAFVTLTLLISVPSAIFFFNWLATIWRGNLVLASPMVFSLGMVFTFGLGGLTGLHLAAVTTDVMLHNTYFVVGHFHLTMASAALLSAFAGIYFWFPKMFGRMMNEKLAHLHFWMTFIPIIIVFVLMMVQGYMGYPRRYYNPYEYSFLKPLLQTNLLIAFSVLTIFLGQVVFFVNFFYSYLRGPKASANPWNVGTLEWTVSSPPPHYNFAKIPVVCTGPHEYSNPKVTDRDWIAQDEYIEGVSRKV